MSFALRVTCTFIVLCFLLCVPAFAQMETATLSGVINDPNGGAVPDVEVIATRIETGAVVTTRTNGAGIYFFTGLMPGHYHLVIRKPGFKEIAIKELELYVQDKSEQNFSLEIGSVSETVTVTAGAPLLNTQDASVSTVVDRQFAENLPLNGRSFQTLIQLTPGVVLTPAQYSQQGQFSVNGQRADANYFTVDGVSANIGVASGFNLIQSGGGALPGLNAFGATNSLVSVDAMQEFRVQTSTFAPEFGRSPGAQVSIRTRSGTNEFHGTVFDYFRNDILDANDWFSDSFGLRKAALRQNDFGGVFGGPVIRKKTFFFFSYEGLRLLQPKTVDSLVPSVEARQAMPAEIQVIANGYPIPNGSSTPDGLAHFVGTYSDRSRLDAVSIRIDHNLNESLIVFGRYVFSPSETNQRGGAPSSVETIKSKTQTLTLGASKSFGTEAVNEMRFNYSRNTGTTAFRLDTFGGAVPPPDSAIFPSFANPETSSFFFAALGLGGGLTSGENASNLQRQWNIVDNISLSRGNHGLKFGVDYRRLSPTSGPRLYDQFVQFDCVTGCANSMTSGVTSFDTIDANTSVAIAFNNLSLYAQDTWLVNSRLSLTYGLRWDFNPPPHALDGKTLITFVNLADPNNLTLAPTGTPLFQSSHTNFGPRIGLAYAISQGNGHQSVLRAGFGIFYDLGTAIAGTTVTNVPFSKSKILFGVPYPFTESDAAPPTLDLNPPYGSLFLPDHRLKLPRTYQWNVAFQQSVGSNQSVAFTYVGSLGRDLERQIALASIDFSTFLNVTSNLATSDYHALQIQFQRHLSQGLQALISYTWSHSIDTASDTITGNSSAPPTLIDPRMDRGPSDFDVRHSFSGAVSYDIPNPRIGSLGEVLLHGWGVDTLALARTATPVDIVGGFILTPAVTNLRPNIVPGQTFYLSDQSAPGGRRLNPDAFALNFSGQQGNLPRNFLRGFAAWQINLVVRRQFRITEKLNLQFRSEFFNLFNHPNFANPDPFLAFGDPNFGRSTSMLAGGLGGGSGQGGLSPLYQVGGPRSIQLALKLKF